MTGTLGTSLLAYALLGVAGLLQLTLVALPACWLIGLVSRRLGHAVPAVRIALLALGPLWALVALLAVASLVAERFEAWDSRRHHYALMNPRVVDGLPLPAGTFVVVESSGRLSRMRLPDGESVVLAGERWGGDVAVRDGRVISGVPSDPVSQDGIPCAAGHAVAFWQDGRLRSCHLAADTAWAGLACHGGRHVEFSEEPVLPPVAACEVRDTYRSDGLACAADQVVRLDRGRLSRCILAEPAARAGLTVPAKAEVTLDFTTRTVVAATAPAPDGWTVGGVTVPPGTSVALRYSGFVQSISLPPGTSVPLGRGRLMHTLYYDERRFERGSLAEALTVGDRTIEAGETVGRAQLGLDQP